MNVLGKVVTTCKEFYQELNPANLTGAIDVIVVRQPDGTLKSTPFHVRFGKMGVLRPGDLQKKVEIEINKEGVPVYMKLDESGSAFFVEQGAPTPTISEMRQLPSPQESIDEGDDTPTNSPKEVLRNQRDNNLFNSEPNTFPIQDGDWSGGVYRSKSAPLEKFSKESEFVFELSDSEESSRETKPGEESSRENKPGEESSRETKPGEESRQETRTRTDDLEGSMEGVQQLHKPTKVEKLAGMGDMSHSLPNDYHALSDSESYHDLKVLEDSTSIHSDTELETGIYRTPLSSSKHQTAHDRRRPPPRPDGFIKSMMNLFRKKNAAEDNDGIYLEDIENVLLPPEERVQYFPQRFTSDSGTKGTSVVGSDDGDSGVGGDRSPVSRRVTSEPSSPLRDAIPPSVLWQQDTDSMISVFSNLELSLCGPLKNKIEEGLFKKHQISFDQFAKNPQLLSNPNLVVKMEGQYHTWSVVAPILMSILVYNRPLPKSTVNRLLEDQSKKCLVSERGRLSYWFSWGRRGESVASSTEETTPVATPTSVTTPTSLARELHCLSSDEGEEQEETKAKKLPRQQSHKRKHKKSLYLPSDQLEKLNLKEGVNEAVFSVTTRFQGTSQAECSIFLWNHKDKIVVSDIDGTITRSDVAGQILPMLGRDWTQAGVVDLFNGVARNGYKFVYLSARPIGYAGPTRSYLKWIRQGNQSLPDGPLLVAPLSVLKAFTKEVIERKPEEFKIACLKELQRLFPKNENPFYAGFGNKVTDEISYRAVDIPTTRMYSINHRGELKNSFNLVFKSSYRKIGDYIDHVFPPCDASEHVDGGVAGEEFSSFNYWRQPVMTFELPEDIV